MDWNWLTRAILKEPLDDSICESCHVIEKTANLVLNELDKQLISAIICPGCQCALPAK